MKKLLNKNRLTSNWKVYFCLIFSINYLLVPSVGLSSPVLQNLIESAMIREFMIERQDVSQIKDSKSQENFIKYLFNKATAELGHPELSHSEKDEIFGEIRGILFNPMNHLGGEDELLALSLEEQQTLMEKLSKLSTKEQDLAKIFLQMKDVNLIRVTDPIDPRLSEKRRFFKGVAEQCELARSKAGVGGELLQLNKVVHQVNSQLTEIALTPLDSRMIEIDGGDSLDLSKQLDREAFARLETSYRANHLLQELVWLYERSGKSDQASAEKAHLHRLLKEAPVRSKSRVGIQGGVNEPEILELEGGVKAVFKSGVLERGRDNEIAAYVIDQLFSFNLVPMTVEREIEGKLGSLQYFVRDTSTVHSNGVRTVDLFPWIHFVKRSDYPAALGGMEGLNERYRRLLGEAPSSLLLFDFLAQVGDRWPERKNFMFRMNGQPVAIDHEGLFCNSLDGLVDRAKSDPRSLYPGNRIFGHLQDVSDQSIRQALAPYVASEKIEGLIGRRADFLKWMKHQLKGQATELSPKAEK